MTLRNAIGLAGLFGALAMGCGGGDGGNSSCSAACAVIVPCIMQSTSACMAQSEGDIREANDVSAECGAAVNDLIDCIAGGSCADFEAWNDEIPPDSYPCRAEDMAIDAC